VGFLWRPLGKTYLRRPRGGFLHGFSTLEADTEVCYKCTNYYDGGSEGSVIWNDSELGIYWGIDPDKAILSKKDAIAASFKDLESPFSI